MHNLGSILLFFSLTVYADSILPQGSGPYLSSVTISELVDESRLDPFNSSHARRLMISRFDPVLAEKCNPVTIPYFTPATATEENKILASYDYPQIFEQFSLQVCKEEERGNGSHQRQKFPIALFSPGLNTTRLFYSSLAQELASHGFIVITVDHPYDVDVVEFPDGSVIYGGQVKKPTMNSSASVEHALQVRADDISYILDTLGCETGDDVVMFGHSFGGAAAATSMLKDPRIKAGVNNDGIMFGPVLHEALGTSSPPRSFILWGSDGHNTTTDESWGKFWTSLESSAHVNYRKEFTIKTSAHGSYWDLDSLVDVAGIREELSETALSLIGPGPGSRIKDILGRYFSGYFMFALGKELEDDILRSPSEKFPEVSILRQ